MAREEGMALAPWGALGGGEPTNIIMYRLEPLALTIIQVTLSRLAKARLMVVLWRSGPGKKSKSRLFLTG